ncbi:MAG: chorismate-binding protein, partial [Acidimicrobiales bacterium]
MSSSPAPVAAVGGVVASELIDVTTDPSALDSTGFWVVMLAFEGPPLCARFARRRPMTGKPARRWQGPPPDAWVSNLDKDGFCERVALIREAIAAGDVYQVNLTRRLSAPLPDDADILALGSALAGGNPSPHAAVLRLPDHGIHVASASPERFLQREG